MNFWKWIPVFVVMLILLVFLAASIQANKDVTLRELITFL